MMNHIMTFAFILVVCICGELSAFQNVPKSTKVPPLVNYVLNCFAESKTNKDLVFVDKMSEYDECHQITRLGFIFDLYQTISLPKARQLMIELVNDFLQQVNNNEKIKPFLAAAPFTAKNVMIRVRLRNKNCGFVYPALGNIAYVSAIDGMIIYDTINSFTYDLDTLRTESFANALKISMSRVNSI